MKIAISSGHGLHVRGASGIIDEVDEARRVADMVAQMLVGMGHGCAVFHDDASTTQNANLAAIANWHNAQERDADVSVHFNAFHDASANGTEVLYRTNDSGELAEKVAQAMATSGGFRLRPAQGGARRQGTALRNDLFVLNRLTEKPAILLEVCFVTNRRDADLYRENFDGICRAIASSLK